MISFVVNAASSSDSFTDGVDGCVFVLVSAVDGDDSLEVC